MHSMNYSVDIDNQDVDLGIENAHRILRENEPHRANQGWPPLSGKETLEPGEAPDLSTDWGTVHAIDARIRASKNAENKVTVHSVWYLNELTTPPVEAIAEPEE